MNGRKLSASDLCWIFDLGYRRMNDGELPGWGAQMGIFSGLAVILMVSSALNVPAVWHAALSIAGIVDTLVTIHFIRRSIRQLRRLGMLGAIRARWWIEMAALNWTLCISIGVFALFHSRPGPGVPAWEQLALSLAAQSARYMFFTFFTLTVVGYLVGLVQRKRVRGESLELVNWWFWLISGIQASYLIAVPPEVVMGIVALCGLVGAAALIAACAMVVRNRFPRQSAAP